MRLPRFTPLEDRLLRRWRIQTLIIAIVWAIFTAVRIGSARQTPLDIVITVVVGLISLAFVVVCILAHLEVRRRAAEAAS